MAELKNTRILQIIPLLLIVVLFCSFTIGKVIYVDDDGQADFDNIQAGIDAANDGDEVLVAPDEYVITEPVTFRGKAITVRSEAGRDGTTIQMGTPADTNRGSVVIFENNETVDSVLDGFTITGGSGCSVWIPEASEFDWAGGGIFFNASSGTVRNCAIVQNRALDSGGGVALGLGSSAILTDCIIDRNAATAKVGGGVICWVNSSATLTNCIITENSVGGQGGGVWCDTNSLMTFVDCNIRDNSAGVGGGVVCWRDSSITMTDCAIMSNTATDCAGGFYLRGSAVLTNCLIARNIGLSWGGGGVMTSYPDTSVTISNCTIWGNSGGSHWGGGGVVCRNASTTVTNSIIWGNTSPKGPEISVQDPASTLTIAYSDVGGGQSGVNVGGGCTLNWGVGNIDTDPLFADPNDGDYHLKSEVGRWDPNTQTWVVDDVASPCIDAGDPNSDWSGEIWPHGERINMGAYGGTREASMSTQTDGMSLPSVVYIYDDEVEAMESFKSLFEMYGVSVLTVSFNDLEQVSLMDYDLIIVGDDTGWLWTFDNVRTAAVEDSGKPVLGLGQGGYTFFGQLGLSIGNPYGGYSRKTSIKVEDPNSSLYRTPYVIDIPEDRAIQLYSETQHIGIYLWPTIPETVTVIGLQVDDVGYHPLIMEHNRYLLWGFTESPQKMTEVGKKLFINVVIWTANKAWESED